MPGRGPTTFNKRQKEQKRTEKRLAKESKRAERKLLKPTGEIDPITGELIYETEGGADDELTGTDEAGDEPGEPGDLRSSGEAKD